LAEERFDGRAINVRLPGLDGLRHRERWNVLSVPLKPQGSFLSDTQLLRLLGRLLLRGGGPPSGSLKLLARNRLGNQNAPHATVAEQPHHRRAVLDLARRSCGHCHSG
jgi:hypothetical protein